MQANAAGPSNVPDLHRWAAEAMTATSSNTPPSDHQLPLTATTQHFDTFPRCASALDRSSTSNQYQRELLASGLRGERPHSMFASTIANDSLLDEELDEQVNGNSSAPSPVQLKSCLKGSQPMMEDIENDSPIIGSMPAGTFSKSVHISTHLPRHRDISSSSDSSSSSMRSRAARRNLDPLKYDAEADKQVPPDEKTPRPKVLTQSSPTWTTSTCDSEDDAPVLMTPLDENGPSCSGHTPPLHTLNEGVADRVGVTRGIGSIGSDVAEPLRLLTELRLPSVREENRLAHKTDNVDVDHPNSAPVLSRSTLIDLGKEKGITPPSLRDANSISSSSEGILSGISAASNVVSTGLEMGLGMRMASSALSSQLPSASVSGIGSFTEPRFQRSVDPEYMEANEEARGLKMTDKQLSNEAAPPGHGSENAAEEVTFNTLEREEAELARRRTTGGLSSRRETRSGPIGKRRPQRVSTQDPHGASRSHNADYTSVPHGSPINSHEAGMPRETSPIAEAIALNSAHCTPQGTPSYGHQALLSPTIPHMDSGSSYASRATPELDEMGPMREILSKSSAAQNVEKSTAPVNLDGGLMGVGELGHFGPGVRSKVAEIIEGLIHTVPLAGYPDETVNMIEYGAFNSRSGLLFRSAISSLSKRARHSVDAKNPDNTAHSDEEERSPVSFCVTHEDSSNFDFRPYSAIIESHPDSYLDAHWQSSHAPSLTNAIYPSFSSRPFGAQVAPPKTMHLGMSLMDLHWTHTPLNSSIPRATVAQAELTAFLNARAREFRSGALLIVAYLARNENHLNGGTVYPSPDSSQRSKNGSVSPEASSHTSFGGHSRKSSLQGEKDIWSTLSNTLAPCIQRLVSCGMLKSDVARHLLSLPMHPRTAKQTNAVLRNVESSWKLEWSCGLGHDNKVENGDLRSEPLPLRLAHPAWKTYKSGCLASVPFTEHMIQLFKNLYESHFRSVLREKGKLSKGAVEFVLDSLWDALFGRIVDKYPNPISDVEIEVCICALRKR